MSFDESFLLTKSMINSGARFKWPQYRNSIVDKHSTGGVGDKISLPLAPALAACGLRVIFLLELKNKSFLNFNKKTVQSFCTPKKFYIRFYFRTKRFP
jgi:hypothetical protein